MKLFAAALLVVLFSTGAWAQRGYRNYGSPGGFGNILFPGMGTQPPLGPATPLTTGLVRPFGAFGSSFPDRFGQSISGFRPSGRGGARGGGVGFGGYGGYAIPYPVYVGVDPGYYAQPDQQLQPNVTLVMPPQNAAPAASPVTINQNFAPAQADQNTVREWGPAARQNQAAPAAAAQPDEQVLFLVALKDSSVYTAVAWWVDGEALHYITPQGKHNQVSLALVDRTVSERLNRGRSVEFRLPQQ
jgi:hypothetical protein